MTQAGTQAKDGARYRWVVLAVFVLSTAINILDRATLAALAPLLKQEFGLTNAQYGWITSAFNLTYAASAPLAGMLIDTLGLNRVISLAVGLWSFAGIATGFTRGLGGLVGCRAVLGVAEAAGIPAAGKAIHKYLLPGERALGNAVNQAGVSLGQIVAPVLATWIAVQQRLARRIRRHRSPRPRLDSAVELGLPTGRRPARFPSSTAAPPCSATAACGSS